MKFGFSDFGLIEWGFLCLVLLVFAVQLFYYLWFYTGVWLKNRKPYAFSADTKLPPVSVIICARNEEQNLRNFLPKVMEQDYPNFEVILVDDASEDDTEIVLNAMKEQYPNLYTTRIPERVTVYSRKKLAVTIGIKAAKHETLLFTDADCYPESSRWIREMVDELADKDFVLGYGDYEQKPTILSRLINYDTLFIAMQYLGFAYRGKPYMAVGRNLMYKKSVFYDNKGFAGHLHLASGDDDLFVNKAANGSNTAIACSAESKTMSLPEPTFDKWINQKKRHLTASPLYSKGSKRLIGGEIFTRGIFYVLLLLSFFTLNITLIASSALMFVLRYVLQTVVINKTSKLLRSRRFFLIIIFADIALPIISLWLMIINKIRRKK